MADLMCAICWWLGEKGEISGGPIRTPAVTVINGHAACPTHVHYAAQSTSIRSVLAARRKKQEGDRGSIDSEGVSAIAAEVAASVLDELASREQQEWEVAPKGEVMSTRDNCALRVLEYREASAALRGEAQ